jgi:hypothetical protein
MQPEFLSGWEALEASYEIIGDNEEAAKCKKKIEELKTIQN